MSGPGRQGCPDLEGKAAGRDEGSGGFPDVLVYTSRSNLCTLFSVTSRRLNLSLDEQRAAKLARLADRAHVPDGTLARSLLSAAIDDADPDAGAVTEILEGIPGLADRLAESEVELEAGEVTELRDL
jgi:hypothetical protein